jgi:hypothetical protein
MRLIAFALLVLVSSRADAHPVKPNLSISATTIAVVRVQDNAVSLELGIGEADKPVFAELLGDAEARQRFFARGFLIETDDPLEGVVKVVEQRKQVERDPVTGEPLAKPAGNAKLITYVQVEYPLVGKPPRLRLKPPPAKAGRAPNIGLVVYHRSIPVNDFDFFNLRETVALDWADPWKSRFAGVQFQRYYNAPVWATMSVEPRAVRLEVMCRPNQPPVSGQIHNSDDIIDRFRTAMTLQADSQFLKPRIEPMRTFRQSLASYKEEKTVSVEARFDCYTFTYPTARRASDIELSWPSLPPSLNEIPLWINTATTPVKLTDKNRTYTWTSETTRGDLGFDTSTHPAANKLRIPVATGLCLFLILIWVLPGLRPFKPWPRRVLCGVVLLGLAALLWPFGVYIGADGPSFHEDDAKRVLRRLLDEAYHAHEAPDEETTYDALAEVVSGPLLREAYLSMKQVFDSDQLGRARIRSVTINSVEKLSYTADAVCRVKCVWTVDVAIIHWGHTHLRANQYEGELTI